VVSYVPYWRTIQFDQTECFDVQWKLLRSHVSTIEFKLKSECLPGSEEQMYQNWYASQFVIPIINNNWPDGAGTSVVLDLKLSSTQ
jgi:hypothetical protein